MKNYPKILILILFILGTVKNTAAQQKSYLLTHNNGFFSIKPSNGKKAVGVSVSLIPCDCYTMELFGNKSILGTESYLDFDTNKNKLIQKYREELDNLHYYDASVYYEIEANNPMKVIFFYYKSIISSSIPT